MKVRHVDRHGKVRHIDEFGRGTFEPDTSGMLAPGRCTRCRHVHDSGPVEVVARYADCTVWKCPGCGSQIDDRPIGWGGSFEPLPRQPRRPLHNPPDARWSPESPAPASRDSQETT